MKILLVLHEATRTGAPRIGGLVASELRRYFPVTVVSLTDGPLRDWLIERVGADHVVIADRGPVHLHTFDDRVSFAKSLLEQHDCDLVYVNSLASSEFLIAAKALHKKVVLHVHEKVEEMQSLLRSQTTKLNVVSLADAIIFAGDNLAKDLSAVFGFSPERVLNWGISVDVEEILRKAKEGIPIAVNVAGEALSFGKRLRIGMVGHASPRKGADIFLGMAKLFPQHDFIWVGNWDEDEAPENVETCQILKDERIENLYLTGGVDNPYKYIKKFDLFFLSSREDPNPVVLAEAMILQVPIFAFSRTTAVADFLGRKVILYHGDVNIRGAAQVLGALKADVIRSDVLAISLEDAKQRFDLRQNVASIVNLLQEL